MATTGFGAIPVRYLNGRAWSGEATWYYTPSTDAAAIYLYDLVNLTGDMDATGHYAVADRTAATEALIVGSVVGFSLQPGPAIYPTNPSIKYRPASTAMYILVADDPNLIFHMREDGVGATIATTDSAAGCDIVATAGSTTTGVSGMVLDSSEPNVSGQMRIWRRANILGNPAIGADDCVWEVTINEHVMRTVTGW